MAMAETLRRTISERIVMPVPCAMVSTRKRARTIGKPASLSVSDERVAVCVTPIASDSVSQASSRLGVNSYHSRVVSFPGSLRNRSLQCWLVDQVIR